MPVNTLRPRQNERHSQTTFSYPFSWMKMHKFRLRFHWSLFPRVQNTNIPALVEMMAWRHPGDKPWSEPMMVSLLTHICVTRPQWVTKPDWLSDRGSRLTNLIVCWLIYIYQRVATHNKNPFIKLMKLSKNYKNCVNSYNARDWNNCITIIVIRGIKL